MNLLWSVHGAVVALYTAVYLAALHGVIFSWGPRGLNLRETSTKTKSRGQSLDKLIIEWIIEPGTQKI
jgi:hypothetical protein